MRMVLPITLALFASALTAPLSAQEGTDEALTEADVVLLGEVHDNPQHHAEQARLTVVVAPKALVFEMLTSQQAAEVRPETRQTAADLAAALNWADSGWPDFDHYYPIFAAAPKAAIYGAALPRAQTQAVMQGGIVASFGADAARFGLDSPLPEAEYEARLTLQAEAHCNALPDTMLPVMIDLQRMRDALLARAALRAWGDTGGPVVVITGNGHARTDWGATALLRRAAPELRVLALGQGEGGNPPSGTFDLIRDAPPVDRPDPCDAFR